jgi:hypothetical protein
VVYIVTRILGEPAASIFRVEEEAECRMYGIDVAETNTTTG